MRTFRRPSMPASISSSTAVGSPLARGTITSAPVGTCSSTAEAGTGAGTVTIPTWLLDRDTHPFRDASVAVLGDDRATDGGVDGWLTGVGRLSWPTSERCRSQVD